MPVDLSQKPIQATQTTSTAGVKCFFFSLDKENLLREILPHFMAQPC